MRASCLTAAVLLTALALSGCSGSKATSSSPPTTGASTHPVSTQPTPVSNVGEHALEFSSSNLRGPAPFNATFTLAARGQTANGTWGVNFGDSTTQATGRGTPNATLRHRYTVAGNLSAVFTFVYADGVRLQKTLNVTVLFTAGATGTRGFKAHYDANIKVPAPVGPPVPPEPALDNAYAHPEANGTYVVWYDFIVEAGAKKLVFSDTATAAQCNDVDIYLRDPDGTYESSNTGSPSESYKTTKLTAGTYSAMVLLWAGASCDVGIDLDLSY